MRRRDGKALRPETNSIGAVVGVLTASAPGAIRAFLMDLFPWAHGPPEREASQTTPEVIRRERTWER